MHNYIHAVNTTATKFNILYSLHVLYIDFVDAQI